MGRGRILVFSEECLNRALPTRFLPKSMGSSAPMARYYFQGFQHRTRFCPGSLTGVIMTANSKLSPGSQHIPTKCPRVCAPGTRRKTSTCLLAQRGDHHGKFETTG